MLERFAILLLGDLRSRSRRIRASEERAEGFEPRVESQSARSTPIVAAKAQAKSVPLVRRPILLRAECPLLAIELWKPRVAFDDGMDDGEVEPICEV